MSRTKQKLYIGILAYAVTTAFLFLIMQATEFPRFAKVIVALLPMLPAIWISKYMLQMITEYDELQRKIVYESAAFSLVATTLLTLSYGFLEEFADFPEMNMVWVWPIIGANLIIGKFISRRRYK